MKINTLFKKILGSSKKKDELVKQPDKESMPIPETQAEQNTGQPSLVDLVNQLNQNKQEKPSVQSDPEYWDRAAEKILNYYMRRHFSTDGNNDVIDCIQYFFGGREVASSFFIEHNSMAKAAAILMNCKDNPTIRGWGVDIYSRSCKKGDLISILVFLEKEHEPSVQQEAIAALTKYLRFRWRDEDQLKAVRSTVKILNEKDRTANEKVGFAMKFLMDEINK